MDMDVKEDKLSESDKESLIRELIEKDSPVSSLNSTIDIRHDTRYKDNDLFYEIVSIWTKERRSEQVMKKIICLFLACILFIEVIFINIVIFNFGQGLLKFDEWTLRLFLVSVFAEITAIIKIIVSNLFPVNGSKEFMDFINALSKTMDDKGD